MNWVIIGPRNGLLPVRRQAVAWINADLLSIGLLGTYLNWNYIIYIQENAMENANMASILSRSEGVGGWGWGWGWGWGGGGGGGGLKLLV